MADGALEIEIGGTGPGQYDRVEVDGLTTLGGSLKVEFVELETGDYTPQLGDTFGFLAAFGGANGMFDDFDLPTLSPGLTWALLPGDVTIFLAIVAAAPPATTTGMVRSTRAITSSGATRSTNPAPTSLPTAIMTARLMPTTTPSGVPTSVKPPESGLARWNSSRPIQPFRNQ